MKHAPLMDIIAPVIVTKVVLTILVTLYVQASLAVPPVEYLVKALTTRVAAVPPTLA